MSDDFDSTILSLTEEIARIRSDLSKRESLISAQAASFARAWWEECVQRHVTADPERTKSVADRLPALKSDLKDLQANADRLAADHLEPAFHGRLDPKALVDEYGHAFYALKGGVAQPHKRWEAPMRMLLGEISTPLEAAGLLSGSDGEFSEGKYRYYENLGDTEVVKTVAAYDLALLDLLNATQALENADRGKAQSEATDLWDQA